MIFLYSWWHKTLVSTFTPLVFLIVLFSCGNAYSQGVTILDQSHYSNVLGEIRNYRVFLPPGYDASPQKKYPVIYYYHGWSQRYFGSTSTFKADEGDSNGGDNIANFVADHDVIVVKADGYKQRPNEKYNLRPYNIGPVENYRQFPLYFPELVDHIDDTFRTIADREHRAISGLSMGGFMTFWIGGKYPHLVSAAGSFCGSPEFHVGPIDFPVEYRHHEMYKNYEAMNVRLNYGDKDFIRDYHKDLNKIWTQVMDNYEYEIYDAAHTTAGLGEMFAFLMESFENPPAKPEKWSHTDIYPAFSVWDYEIKTDRNKPGFTILENVDERGFRTSVKTFLPDGELMPYVNLTVITPPVYEKNQQYQINDIKPLTGKTSVKTIKSDEKGRLKINLNGNLHEIGINKSADSPNIAVAGFEVENTGWATHGKEMKLSVKLVNKGSEMANGITASLKSTRPTAVVSQPEVKFRNIATNEIATASRPFSFTVSNNDVEIERFEVTIKDRKGNQWRDVIDIPIRTEGPEIDFVIADGKEFEVAAAGDDTVKVYLGKGNGDGKANPGELIVVLANDNGRYYRTFLHSSDQNINPGGAHIRKSDNWGSYDHVGGSAKYSIPVIASATPENHRIKLFAEYWLPDYPIHIIKRGVANIEVTGTDKVSPVLDWVSFSGDNTLKVKLYDGGKISSVKALFRLIEDPEKSFTTDLNKNSETGELFFSSKIEERGFGLYKVEIEATDAYGNTMKEEWPETLVVH